MPSHPPNRPSDQRPGIRPSNPRASRAPLALALLALSLGGCFAVGDRDRRFEDPECELDADCAPLPRAAVTCERGFCRVGTCESGFDECNADPDDGCEARLDTAMDCGACGVVCALIDGVPYCAGRSGNGELSTTPGADWTRPDAVAYGGMEIVADAVAVGGAHGCALQAMELRCWGNATLGQLMDNVERLIGPARDVPRPITTSGFVEASLGRLHSCVRVLRGAETHAYCAGDNSVGALGRPTARSFDASLAEVELAGEEDEVAAPTTSRARAREARSHAGDTTTAGSSGARRRGASTPPPGWSSE